MQFSPERLDPASVGNRGDVRFLAAWGAFFLMDARELSPKVLQMMLAMTVPMQHLEWAMAGVGGVKPVLLKVPLPGKRFDRLDPGYGNADDYEIWHSIMAPVARYEGRVRTFLPGMLARLEHERRKLKGG